MTATTTLPELHPDGGAAGWIAGLLPTRVAGQEHLFAARADDGEVAGVVGLADVQGPGGSAELGYSVGVLCTGAAATPPRRAPWRWISPSGSWACRR
ncbi:hypothetical protein [Longimicrobium sp.]|uniref:GNAT family N-acetyltransferase n=1 Tax=Longimicrobium sp. TaxID=2029185 RepID=UPI002EDB7990